MVKIDIRQHFYFKKAKKKNGIFQISILYDDPFPRYELFVFDLYEVLLVHTSRVILIYLYFLFVLAAICTAVKGCSYWTWTTTCVLRSSEAAPKSREGFVSGVKGCGDQQGKE